MTRYVFDSKKKVGSNKNYWSSDFTTPEELVKDLLNLVPFKKNDSVIDAGSGLRKVWFNNIPTNNKESVEIKDGEDFKEYNKKVDWVVGNPPFTEFISFIFKSSEICKKGFAFLTNHSRINQLTPKRLDDLKEKGFYLSKIHIFGCKKWFGRYYFLVWTKEESKDISWVRKTY